MVYCCSCIHVLVDLVQVLVDLVQAHSPPGGLQLVVSRQVVVGPILGLIGSVWSVFVRGVRRKQVCYSQFVHGLGVGLVVSGRKGGAGYIAPHVAQGVQQWGLMLGYIALIQS